MKKNFIFLIVTTALLFLSCQNQVFLPNPDIYPHNDSNSSDVNVDTGWSAPEELKATQGAKRIITLTWKPVKDAVRYNIYRSEDPFSQFYQIGETKTGDDKCEFVIKTEPGTDKYYRVTAVKKEDGRYYESDMSNVERATTLSKPIINSVEGKEGAADSDIYVSWYMNNIDAYSDDVYYEVSCLDEKNKVVQCQQSKGNETTVLFTGLNPNTNYFYRVEAYNKDNEFESSEIVDAATARRLRPDPVKDLTITQGISKESLTLSFDLPDFVDVSVGKNLYESVPVYFKIYRRVYKDGGNKEPFELIKNDFGVNYTNTGFEAKKIDYTKVNFGSKAEDYTPGNTVTYVDDIELKRGEKYEYKVQSFAYIERDISSDESIAISKEPGWLLPEYTFETKKLNYTFSGEGENKKKTDASLQFNLIIDTYGIPYKFKINEVRRGLSKDSPVTKGDLTFENGKTEVDSVKEITDFVRKFNNLKDEAGYYKYKITVLSDNGVELDSYEAIGESLVSDSMDIPNIGDVKLTSGYADRIELEWNWNSAYKYTLKYWDDDGISGEVTNDEILANHKGEKVVYEDVTAKPGVKRTYQLVIDYNGFNIPSGMMEGTVPLKPILNPKYFYDRISVGVANAADKSNYKVETSFADSALDSNYEIKPVENIESSLYFDYEIVKKSSGKNTGVIDATVAGAKVNVSVTEKKPLSIKTYKNTSTLSSKQKVSSQTSETSDFTEVSGEEQLLTSEITTATVGQALMNVSASEGTSSDSISVRWNKVIGANDYVIFRDRYHIGQGEKEDIELKGSEKYIVTLNNDTVSVSSDADLGNYVSVTYDKSSETFTLKDMYRPYSPEADVGDSWKKGQSEITWGAPNKYTVVPVVSVTDAENCEKNSKDSIVKINNSIKIANSKNAMGGTKGFGWNVMSSKGTYSGAKSSGYKVNNGIEITWTEPYFRKSSEYILFRRSGTEGKWEKLPTTISVPRYVDTNIEQGKFYDYAVVDSGYRSQYPDSNFIADQRAGESAQNAVGFVLPRPTISGVSRTDMGIGIEEVQFFGQYMDGKLNNMFDGYAIQVRNNNIDSNWHDIEIVPITESNKNEANFKIKVNNDEGLLKVLRDYKHYFRICAYKNVDGERIYSMAEENFTNNMNTDYVKWGCRQISVDEFARAAIIGMSTGMEKERGGKKCNEGGNGITGLKSESKFNIGPSDFTLTMKYSDYTANHNTQGSKNSEVSSVKINGNLYARGGLLWAYQTHYWSDSLSVTYFGNNEKGTIKFNGDTSKGGSSVSNGSGTITVTWDGKTKTYDMSKPNEIGQLPFMFGSGSYLNNSEEWK